jgi:hypothetical protein
MKTNKYDNCMGQEPTKISTNMDLAHAYNYYNYHYTYQDAKKWVLEWLKKNPISKPTMRAYEASRDSYTSITMGAIARMSLRKVEGLPDSAIQFLTLRIVTIAQANPIVKKKAVSLPQAISPPAENTLLTEMETQLDEFIKDDYRPFDLALDLSTAKRADIQAVVDYYQPLSDELKVGGEGYDHLKPKQLKSYRKFVDAIISKCLTHLNQTKKERKPRKRKPKPASFQVRKMKFLKSFAYDFGTLLSVAPESIIGAKNVWLLNTKTRQFMRLYSETGMTVRGSTIYDFVPEKSNILILRKPEQVLPKLIAGTIKQGDVLLSKLKTKRKPAHGSVGKDTIIMRATK